MRVLVGATFVVLLGLPMFAQTHSIPRFEDYPVTAVFHGTPAAPVLETREENLYRTRIRLGVGKGDYAAYGMPRPEVNFAGHYFVVTWECGSPCNEMAIVDAVSGKISNPPMSKTHLLPTLDGGPWFPRVDFRLNSKLMIMTPSPNMARVPIYIHYFLWDNNKWTLIQKVPCRPKGSVTGCEE